MSYQRQRKKPVAEMNVVPYIDVMLVLLVIFMITAPMLNQSVEIDLPQANAEPVASQQEPLIVSITNQGDIYLNVEGVPELVDTETLLTKTSAFIRRNKDLSVLIGGDEQVAYGKIYEVMALLQQAGAEKIGLMSDPLDGGTQK